MSVQAIWRAIERDTLILIIVKYISLCTPAILSSSKNKKYLSTIEWRDLIYKNRRLAQNVKYTNQYRLTQLILVAVVGFVQEPEMFFTKKKKKNKTDQEFVKFWFTLQHSIVFLNQGRDLDSNFDQNIYWSKFFSQKFKSQFEQKHQ